CRHWRTSATSDRRRLGGARPMLKSLETIAKAVLVMVAPFKLIAKHGASLTVSPAALWFWRLLVVVAVCVLLGFLSKPYFEMRRLQLFGMPQWTYLPILFLLFPCAFSCLVWLIWRVASAEESTGSYPEIDKAWSEAMDALRK